MSRSASFLGGAILGGMVGAAVALLLAPSSGDQFRTDLNQNVQRIRDEVQQAANQRREELERELARLRRTEQV